MNTNALSRALRRASLVVGVTVGLGLVTSTAAQAHVSVQPGDAEGSSFSVVSFRVPNERDDASTQRLRVILPTDQPVGSVSTTPVPGWRVTTKTRQLDEPIDFFGEKLDSVVSEVRWTATGDGIAPGQYQDFPLNLGPLPAKGSMTFKALQTYSSGEEVAWNQVAADGAAEPEHPAPVLNITAAGDKAAAGSHHADQVQADAKTSPVAASVQESPSMLPTGLAGAALLVSLAALVVAWRRGRA